MIPHPGGSRVCGRLYGMNKAFLPDPNSRRIARRLVKAGMFATVVVLFLGGCQLLESRPDAESAEGPAPDPPVSEEETETPTLARAIDLLQEGNTGEAEEILQALADAESSSIVPRLLEQIRQPPETLLGEEYIEITVQAGDSLSGLAAEYVGDSLMFFALARLNDIERPRLLQPGTTLKVPAPTEDAEEDPPGDEGLEIAAAQMIAEGRSDQAFPLLLSAARSGSLDEAGVQQLMAASAKVAGKAISDNQFEEARRVLDSVQIWAERAPDPAPYQRQRRRLEARVALEAAREARSQGEREEERELLVKALESDPELDQAARALEEAEAFLVERYHDRALRAWRDQEVREAANLWERVLEIDPEFEPAAVYLERAKAVLSRLEEL